jgi:hypothetical protein
MFGLSFVWFVCVLNVCVCVCDRVFACKAWFCLPPRPPPCLNLLLFFLSFFFLFFLPGKIGGITLRHCPLSFKDACQVHQLRSAICRWVSRRWYVDDMMKRHKWWGFFFVYGFFFFFVHLSILRFFFFFDFCIPFEEKILSIHEKSTEHAGSS